jgi:hypothetical protein
LISIFPFPLRFFGVEESRRVTVVLPGAISRTSACFANSFRPSGVVDHGFSFNLVIEPAMLADGITGPGNL